MTVDVVIIGAGLTGLSAAYHLEQAGFHDYVVLEKESSAGGLCRSVNKDGFTFDFTGHLLHINNDYFKKLIEELVGFENFNAINRRSYIFSEQVFTKYPYQINLHGLPTHTIATCIEEFIKRPTVKNPKTFYSWVLTNFGKGFADHFFFPYQTKIFDFPVKKLTASWTGRFVPQTSLSQILDGALAAQEPVAVGYNAHFLYPKKNGIFFWVNKLAQALHKKPITQSQVTAVDPAAKRITLQDGSTIAYKKLISTMPLDQLLGTLKEPSSSSLKKARSKLKCNSVINFNLGVNRPDLSDKHWVYYPETQYPFYRIGFPHNFADSMAPAGCSSLYGELSSLSRSPQELSGKLTQALNLTKKLWNIAPHDILTEHIIRIPHAYVIYDRWRDKHLPNLLKELAFLDIHSVGRYGAWKYASMQEGVLDGKDVAETILAQYGAIKTPTMQQEISL